MKYLNSYLSLLKLFSLLFLLFFLLGIACRNNKNPTEPEPGGTVYAAGQLWAPDAESFYLLARWHGGSWIMLGNEITPSVQAELYELRGLCLAVQGNDIYLGGQTLNQVAKLNGNSWQVLTGGVHNLEDGDGDLPPYGVNALAISGSNVYVGGVFNAVGESN
ncbi:MAG: hypothetical protein GWN00_13235 [Aliifodinibius sp.]|nr:hypothetical protein [Fodinibius sp.]NIU14190.1 hypothetical protein [candidate division Zixibacteria bacterium]NIV16520.1 hypothetical protein [Fodinibius sp.]NIY25735.1 hypothetical protein [Fodinibius sp.]